MDGMKRSTGAIKTHSIKRSNKKVFDYCSTFEYFPAISLATCICLFVCWE